MELAACLERPGGRATVERTLSEPGFRRLGSDRRFETVMLALRQSGAASEDDVVRNSRGDPVICVERAGRTVRFIVDERLAPALGSFVLHALPALVERFEAAGSAASAPAANEHCQARVVADRA